MHQDKTSSRTLGLYTTRPSHHEFCCGICWGLDFARRLGARNILDGNISKSLKAPWPANAALGKTCSLQTLMFPYTRCSLCGVLRANFPGVHLKHTCFMSPHPPTKERLVQDSRCLCHAQGSKLAVAAAAAAAASATAFAGKALSGERPLPS